MAATIDTPSNKQRKSKYYSYESETLVFRVNVPLRRFQVCVKIVSDCSAVRATLTKRDQIPRSAMVVTYSGIRYEHSRKAMQVYERT